MQIAQVIGGSRWAVRSAAPRDGEEEARGRWPAGATSSLRRAEERPPRGKATQLFDLMEKFAATAQQVARRGLRAAGVSDGIHEIASRRGVMAATFGSEGRHRQGAHCTRMRSPTACESCRRRQCLRIPLRAGGPANDPLRPRRGAWYRRVGDRRGPRARKAAPFTDLFDFCRRVDKRIVNRP